MSEKKRKKVYEALLDGACHGLTDESLYKFVLEHCPKTNSKRIVRASLLALEDPHVKDVNVLHVIYALAIKHRLKEEAAKTAGDTDDDKAAEPDSLSVAAE